DEEEAQPDAFALPALADLVHPVVPVAAAHQRQAMAAPWHRMLDGTHAVRIQRGALAGRARLVVPGFLAGPQRAAFDVLDEFVQHAGVGTGLDIATGRQRQPQVIVRARGAYAAVAGRMPPVHHVALGELVRRAYQQLRTGHGGYRV